MTDRVWQEPDNGLDHAVTRFGGKRSEWLDLSTGVNPVPYPAPQLPADTWTALPDQAAIARLVGYARRFWSVPESAVILPTAGTAPIIAALPHLRPAADVSIAPRRIANMRLPFVPLAGLCPRQALTLSSQCIPICSMAERGRLTS